MIAFQCIAVCDQCGKEVQVGKRLYRDSYLDEMSTELDAADSNAIKYGWSMRNGKHYCINCTEAKKGAENDG